MGSGESLRQFLAILRPIVESSDPGEIARATVLGAASLTQGDACLFLSSEPGQPAVLACSTALAEQRAGEFLAPPDRDGRCDEPALRGLLELQPSDTLLTVPLARGGTAGLLVVYRRVEAGTVQDSTAQIPEAWSVLFALAEHAAVALENAAHLKRAEDAAAAAAAAERMFRDLIESAPDAALIIRRDGRVLLVNGETERLFGYPREELLGRSFELLIPERYRTRHQEHHVRYFADPQLRPMGSGLELFGRRRDGGEFPVEILLGPLEAPEGTIVTAIVRDITDRRRGEEERAQLLASEHQKSEQLMLAVREAHHRIKNNLQAISDLLSLELASTQDSVSIEILRDSMERIQAIALVHDLLSRDEDLERVNLRQVVERLVPMVLRSSGASGADVAAKIDVAGVALASKKATTLALVLNELISNAVKHALAGKGGRLAVSLVQEGGQLLLTVQDSGPGLPPDFDLASHAHVGLKVVQTLVEGDLEGNLALRSQDGLRVEARFPIEGVR